MRPSEALAKHLGAVQAAIARSPVSNARLFGSVARGEDTENSDLDLLVDLPEDASYYELFKLQDALKAILGCSVEIYPADNRDSRFFSRIGPDLKPV